MDCCIHCFGSDRYIKSHIAEFGSIGNCPRCGEQNISILSTASLTQQFEFLMSIYEEVDQDHGQSIADCLSADWEIFKDKDKARSLQLLADILSHPDLRIKYYKPTEYGEITPKQKWINFCEELVHEFRFFPVNAPDINYLPVLFQHLVTDVSDPIYRARIETEIRYKKNEMGMPPAKLTRGGRANPVGIPYFYGASNIDTAIAEVRPHPGNHVSVAKFKVIDSLKLINLIDPRARISPFAIAYQSGDEDYLLKLRYDVEFLSHLGEVLSTPITPHVAELEYLPTQYLCELIKKSGYDGVMFDSSVGSGKNVALFSANKLKAMNVLTHRINTLQYTSKLTAD